MATFTVQIDFGSGNVDITDDVIHKSFARRRKIHNRLRPTTDECTFLLQGDTSVLSDLLTAPDDTVVTITKDSAAYFKGYLSPRFRIPIKSVRNQPIQIKVEDWLRYRLDKDVEVNARYATHKVCDTTTTSNSLVHKLLTEAGFAAGELNITTDIDKTITDYVLFSESNARYWGLLERLLFEFGYTFYADEEGRFCLFDLFPASTTTTNKFQNTSTKSARNIIGEVEVGRVEQRYDDCRVSYHPVETLTGVKVYEDTTGGSGDSPASIPVANGDYYPEDGNTRDIYQQYRRDEGEVVSVSNVSTTVEPSSTFTETFTNYYVQGKLLLENATGSQQTITRLEIWGDATIRTDSVNKVRAEVTAGSDHVYEYNASYLEAIADAEYLATGIGRYYKHSVITYDLRSRTSYAVGAIADVDEDRNGIDQTCMIIGREDRVQIDGSTGELEEVHTYHLEAIEAFASTTPTTTTSQPTAPVRDQVETRPTYTDLQDGYDAGGGTTTPTTPTLVAVGGVKQTKLAWTKQSNLTNFERYEIQVSDDSGSTAYSVVNGQQVGSSGGTTAVYSEEYLHQDVPLNGTTNAPQNVTLDYRVRTVNKAGTQSAWSAWATVTVQRVERGLLEEAAINTEKLADLAIVEGKISDDAVTTAKLVDDAISAAKLAAGAIKAPNEGLVAHWSFDDGAGTTATDNSGNGNDGTVNGATWVDGVAGKALRFDGVDDEVQFSLAVNLTTEATMCGWFFWESGTASLLRDNTSSNGWILAYNNSGTIHYRVGGSDFSTGETVSAYQNSWHHYCAVVESGGATRYYIDGALVSSGSSAGSTASANPFHIMRNGSASSYVKGDSDDVRIYNRALTLAEIRFLYNNPGATGWVMVDASRIQTDAITGDKILDDAITQAKVAAGAIDTTELANLAIEAAKLATDAVTETKIAAGAVVAAKIAAGAIVAGKIAAGAVDTDELAANAITAAKIAAGTITATEIASNAITADKILASAVTTAKLAAGAVTANEIAANVITAAKIAADTITADELALAENFVFTGSVGSETAASPSNGDTRAYFGKDPAGAQGASDPLELAIRGYNGQEWEYLARIYAKSDGKKADGLVLGTFNAAEKLGSKFGKFWYQANIGGTEPNYSGAVAYDGSDIIVFGTDGADTYYSKSTDKGLTWSNWALCSATAPNTSVRPTDAASPAAGVFIATLRGPGAPLLRTANGGTSFSVLQPLGGSSAVLLWGIAAGDTYTVAVGAENIAGSPTILYSSDDGATWSSVSTTTFGSDSEIKGVGFGNGRFIAVGDDGANAHVAYADETNITSWTEITTHSFSGTVEAAEYSEGVWNLCGDNGEAAYSEDDGATWTHTDPGTSGDNFTEMLAFDRQVIIQDFNAGPVHRSVDNGRTWELFDSMPAYFGDFAVIDSERVIAPMSLDGPVYISEWTEAGAGIIERGESGSGKYVKFSDGTMVCWGTFDSGALSIQNDNIGTYGISYYQSTPSITFPESFSSSPVVSPGSSRSIASSPFWVSPDTVTTTSARMVVADNGSSTLTDLAWIAIGRWR
jgi:hypothetical protein